MRFADRVSKAAEVEDKKKKDLSSRLMEDDPE